MSELPPAIVGSVVAALIAAIISLLTLIISKEQKTSEFRQAWIDALRIELSGLIAHANAIHSTYSAMNPNPAEMWKEMKSDYTSINGLAARIMLRLNPDGTLERRILSHMHEIETLLAPTNLAATGYNALDAVEKSLADDGQLLLKQEWLRVRRGEITFRIARFLTAVIVLACMIALLVYAYPGHPIFF